MSTMDTIKKKLIIANARLAAKRDGYPQLIIEETNKNGKKEYAFERYYLNMEFLEGESAIGIVNYDFFKGTSTFKEW